MKPIARTLQIAALALSILVLAAPSFAGAACPLSLYRFGPGPAFESSAPTQVFSFGSPGTCDSGGASWDLSVGKLALALKPCARDSAEVRIRDTFVITGPPPGTPLQVYVQMQCNTYSTVICGINGCEVKHTLVVGAGTDVDSVYFTQPFTGITAAIGYHAIAGQPFNVRAALGLHVPAGAEGHSDGDLRFTVQAGTLTSCNGYSEQPTPVSRTSWGRVRAAYR